MFSLAALGCEQPSSLEEEIELTNNVKIPAMLNAAACQIESKVIFFLIQNYEAAIYACDAVIQSDPNNTKALLRKGKALILSDKVEEGKKIITDLSNKISQVLLLYLE